MRFHILGVPHTVTNEDYVACAYTQKVLKFGKMMTGLPGITTFHYGHQDSKIICDEHITVTTNRDFEIAYGDYDWRKNFFKYSLNDHAYQTFYKNAIREIQKRWQPRDFILPFWGSGVRRVCDEIQETCELPIILEPGIGYSGGQWAQYKVWESYCIMHAFGGVNRVGTCSPSWYDVVIPNYFDPDQFTYRDETQKEDYFLYLGRVYEGKGVHIAMQAAERAGVKLVIAGQKEEGFKLHGNVEYVGYADVEKRKELMSKAKGSFLPTLYYEPFGGVQIENLFSGTPTITCDWGAFAENNLHGVTGYRCRTMDDYISAIEKIQEGKIKSKACFDWAQNFTLDAIRPRYIHYFQDVLDIYTSDGWYANSPKEQRDRDLDAMTMKYPQL